ncbi:hypothetical protein BGZ60DRAFT_413475 [Tricladium varicosporioides]|nr:hypothetical protein BGZ60DRAFT_413475 [Hymenoscyphus varicosporioides]
MYPSAEPSPTGLGIRGGGETSPYSTPGMEADPFLPSYAQSQSGMSSGNRNSFGRLHSVNTSISSPSTADVSPMSAHPSPSPMSAHAHPSGRSVLPPPIPQFANAIPVSSIPEVDSPRFQLEHRDTMGFPVDSDSPEIPSMPYQEIPLAAPAPRHPLIHQDSLERVVRQGMSTPEPGTLAPTNPLLQQPRHSGPVARLLSGQYPATESPVLGMQNPVTIHAPQPAALQPSGLGRNVSQRTVSSVSSMGPSVISDTELERLGVGPGGRF